MEVDLEIYNGQGSGSPITQALESGDVDDVGHGAFTVANINDTDGDWRVDYQDNLVKPFSANITEGGTVGLDQVTVDDASGFVAGDSIALRLDDEYDVTQILGFRGPNQNTIDIDHVLTTDFTGGTVTHTGRDEVDLMKLIVHRPTAVMPNTNVKLTVVSGNVALWTSPTKGTANAVPLTAGTAEFNVDIIPGGGLVLWVEALSPSTAVRDIELRLDYMGASDIVNATAVWATQPWGWDDKMSYEQVTDLFPDIVDTSVGDLVEISGGLGLIPFSAFSVLGGVVNVILMQSTVGPPGIGMESIVSWDVTRQIRFIDWTKVLTTDDWVFDPDTKEDFPLLAELPNDDDIEEEDLDETASPTGEDHMYSIDVPGVVPALTFGKSARRLKFSFREWIRVRFDGAPFSGETIAGSRASDMYEWHARHDLEKHGTGFWRRTTGDEQETNVNDIGPGAIDVFGEP